MKAGIRSSRRDSASLWLFLLTLLSFLRVSVANEAQGPGGGSERLRIGILRPGGGSLVETLPIEAYVAHVLAGEAARDSAPAALEALAITIRTFAVANRGRHRADGFDLCDQTHCQCSVR
jgi:peptidoglycan hydrolase-like amidase